VRARQQEGRARLAKRIIFNDLIRETQSGRKGDGGDLPSQFRPAGSSGELPYRRDWAGGRPIAIFDHSNLWNIR